MSARTFNGCDIVESNFSVLRVGGPYNCTVKTKPLPETLEIATGADVTAGDTSITVTTGLTFALPANVELDFNGVVLVTADETTAASTTINIEPAPDAVAALETATVSPLFEVYSASEVSDSMSETELTDRVLASGIWMTNKIVTRGAELSINGFRIKNDPGFAVIEKCSKTTQHVYFELIEPDGVTGHEGFGNPKGLNRTRQVDANQSISFTIGVDGEYKDLVVA